MAIRTRSTTVPGATPITGVITALGIISDVIIDTTPPTMTATSDVTDITMAARMITTAAYTGTNADIVTITITGMMITITMTVVTIVTGTGVSPGHASVILHGLKDYAPSPGHSVSTVNHYHETILSKTQNKNRQLEDFFIDWEKRAFYIAYAALWDRESALDAVQEAMTRLVEYYRDKPAEQWPALFRSVLNSKINDIRRRRMIEQGKHKLVSLTGLFQKDSEADDTEYELPETGRDDELSAPEAALVARELRGRVAEALQSLSERQRQVFILREWRGMSIKETAQTLGCSGNSVKQHHFRALRALRVQLAEVWDHAQAATS